MSICLCFWRFLFTLQLISSRTGLISSFGLKELTVLKLIFGSDKLSSYLFSKRQDWGGNILAVTSITFGFCAVAESSYLMTDSCREVILFIFIVFDNNID